MTKKQQEKAAKKVAQKDMEERELPEAAPIREEFENPFPEMERILFKYGNV